MTVTVHPDRGQPLADLARALLAVADHPRDVRPVTGSRPGYQVSDGVAHAYLSGRLGVQAPPLSLLGVVPASVPAVEFDTSPAVFEPLPPAADEETSIERESVPLADPLDVPVPPAHEPTPDLPPKRGPGRPRKTAPPATTEEVP